MKERTCQIVSEEDIVAYTDGELSASETERIAKHIATCANCQAMNEALERSIGVTQAIWQTGQSQWPETRRLDETRPGWLSRRKVTAVAAVILIVLASSVLWRLLSGRGDHTHVIGEDAKIAEMKLKIADSADAARLLAAAELLSRYPGAEDGLKPRYQHIVDTYPETGAAGKARLRAQQFK